MNTYNIVMADGQSWDSVPALNMNHLLWTRETDVEAFAQLCYSQDALHVRLWARESDIRAEEHGPLGMPCEDSCLEFFFCPIEGDERYFNIEFNPNKCFYLGLGSGIDDLTRLLPPDATEIFRPFAARTTDGWELCYRIPGEFIRRFFPSFEIKPGVSMRANCYKCGDSTVKPHYLAWNPISGDVPAFHRPAEFGVMRIV